MATDHIVMLPFLSQGHLIPFLALAELISHHHPSLSITIATTPLNIRTLDPLLPPGSNIRLHPLPFRSSDHGLPPGSENTDSLSRPDQLHFYPATQSLRPHFVRLLSSLPCPPLLIIADVFFGWTVQIARDLRVPHAVLTTCGALGTAAYFSAYLHRPQSLNSEEFTLLGFPDSFRLHPSQFSTSVLSADGSEPPLLDFFRSQILLSLNSDALLCNTVEELEPEGLQIFRSTTSLRVWSVGPLLHSRSADGQAVVSWMDNHPSASVIYVSFGSQNSISAPNMMALAAGLEASGSAFVWVVRPPAGLSTDDECLPEGFEERVSGRGLLVRRWGPQVEILSHPSTGAFVSHCGWNSVQESLSLGVPVIGWPLAAEQFYNSKMMVEEMGVAVELARGGREGGVVVESGEVERVIRMVMSGEEGKEMRRKAVEARGVIGDAMREEGGVIGSSLRAVDDFIHTMVFSGGPKPDN